LSLYFVNVEFYNPIIVSLFLLLLNFFGFVVQPRAVSDDDRDRQVLVLHLFRGEVMICQQGVLDDLHVQQESGHGELGRSKQCLL